MKKSDMKVNHHGNNIVMIRNKSTFELFTIFQSSKEFSITRSEGVSFYLPNKFDYFSRREYNISHV